MVNELTILIKNATVLDLKKFAAVENDILIEGNKISKIGVDIEVNEKENLKIIDGSNKVALPGLINGHTHVAMTLFRGAADDLPLMDWLNNVIWPSESRLTGEDVYWGSLLGIVEMIKSGTTTFCDMYFFMDEVAHAVEQSGIRAILSRGMVAIDPANGEKGLKESVDFIEKWQGKANGRITTALAPHAPYTCPPEFLKDVIWEAKRLNVPINIHISETLDEISIIKERYGTTPVRHLESLGLFEVKTIGAHLVYVDDEEIQILKRYQVGAIHNPQSNMKLASGIAPVAKMLEAGVLVGLGTDGAASNNDLDMIEELRTASYLQKVSSMNPEALNAKTSIAMATSLGARALGLTEVGLLQEGYKADIILLNTNETNFYPRHNIFNLIAYSAKGADVDTVIVDGEVIMEKRQLTRLDEEKIKFEANKRGLKLVAG
ncbi:amidohydrolase [Carboxydothermus ferrireducens]|uniref:amidohydrolase n=1 Tax=Carboxydothermus ferrireducens TaxID=54265 RepID=UPI0005546F3A|nr:amidohydrolase [Carboxydothermus ferrireducens]